MSEWTKTRSKIAQTVRQNPNADTTELRRQLKAERLEDRIRREAEADPPLTDAQRARLAALLVTPQKAGGDNAAA
jgi:hypothetical protein